MASTIKVLGQLYPTANTATKLYTVPALTSTVCSSIFICNQGAVQDTYKVAVRVAGAGDATKDKLYYLLTIAANDTFIATVGLTLAATDEIWVTSVLGTCSFNLFGEETT